MNKLSNVLKELDLRFTSGNSVPVKEIRISREEYDILRGPVSHDKVSTNSDEWELILCDCGNQRSCPQGKTGLCTKCSIWKRKQK